MAAEILDGKALSERILLEIEEKVVESRTRYGSVPGLATILVGEDPASQVYVRKKKEVASSLHFHHRDVHLPKEATLSKLLEVIQDCNNDPNIDGILIQKPLPQHIDFDEVMDKVDWKKDVDGFHPYNVGSFFIKNWKEKDFEDLLRGNLEGITFPCTPKGVLRLLLEKSLFSRKGENIVVVGSSNIVGKPLAFILAQAFFKASLTLCDKGYSHEELAEKTRSADILIVAAGVPHLIGGQDIKPGAVVVDVGINRIKDEKTGKNLLVGDVNFEEAKDIASFITPVPGGVGPMTIAMLMENTWMNFKRRLSKTKKPS